MLNQQDLAKNGRGHLKSGCGEVDSACTHAWHKKTLSLEAAFLPVIDDLPAFVLLISMVRSPLILLLPSSLSPPVPFFSYCPPPSGPLFLHPPILPPSHHSLTIMPSSPSLKALDPVTPSPHVSSFKYNYIAWVHIKTSTHFWRPELDTVAYIYIGVGRCSDLGGATFFLNNKNVISLRNNPYMQYGLQYCNKVHYVNSG